jgi:hypothetical protein
MIKVALSRCHEAVLGQGRSIVREMIAKEKRARKARHRSVGVIDDELQINAGEQRERTTGRAEGLRSRPLRRSTEAVFEEARRRVPMLEVPKSLLPMVTTDEELDEPQRQLASIVRKKFEGFK